ncbi:hypothetical protein Plhal703r1_c37g0133281 [Plasmopara halstedii]
MSHFKPSYLWQKLASSWIMRFFRPHIYLRHAADKEAAGEKLLKKVDADQAVDFFNSHQFQKWSKYFVDAFPDNPDEAARLMVSILAEHRMEKLIDSIPTTKVVDDKLAFGDRFEVALKDYIANAKHDVELKPFADRLEYSLLKLSTRLKVDEGSKSIGDRIEIGILNGWFRNNDNLVDVFKSQNMQNWYLFKPQELASTRARDLYRKIEQLGISEEKLGEAHFKADGDARFITKELVDYKLADMMAKVDVYDALKADESRALSSWGKTAIRLKADPVTSILPSFTSIFYANEVLELSQLLFPKTIQYSIRKAMADSWDLDLDIDLLKTLNRETFSFDLLCSRAWMDYMSRCYGSKADVQMVSALKLYKPERIPTLIQEGETSAEADVLSLTEALKKSLQEVPP